jgi:hypothetical protein
MLSDALERRLKLSALTQRILWSAMTISIFIVSGLAFLMLITNSHDKSPPVSYDLRNIFYGLGLGLAVLSVFTRRYLISDKRIQTILSQDFDPSDLVSKGESGHFDEEQLSQMKALSLSEQKLYRLINKSVAAVMLPLAVNHIIVFLGLALAFLEKDFSIMIPFALFPLLINIIYFPRPRTIINRAQQWVL